MAPPKEKADVILADQLAQMLAHFKQQDNERREEMQRLERERENERRERANERENERRERESERRERDEMFARLLESVTTASQAATAAAATAATAPPAVPANSPSPAATTLAPATTGHPHAAAPAKAVVPDRLPCDANIATFNEWKRQWSDYAILTNVAACTQERQMAQLRQTLSSDILNVLRHNLLIPDDTTRPIAEIIHEIEGYVKSQENPTARRFNFNRCRQDIGEDFDHFAARLRQAALDANLCIHCRDSRILDGLITGINDEGLRTELLTRVDAKLEDAIKFARNYLIARKTCTEVEQTSHKANATSSYSNGNAGNP